MFIKKSPWSIFVNLKSSEIDFVELGNNRSRHIPKICLTHSWTFWIWDISQKTWNWHLVNLWNKKPINQETNTKQPRNLELARQPKALILDEPTTGLDSDSAREICKMLKEVSKSIPVFTAELVHVLFAFDMLARIRHIASVGCPRIQLENCQRVDRKKNTSAMFICQYQVTSRQIVWLRSSPLLSLWRQVPWLTYASGRAHQASSVGMQTKNHKRAKNSAEA